MDTTMASPGMYDRVQSTGVTAGSQTTTAAQFKYDGAASNFDTSNHLTLQSAIYDASGNQTVIGGYAQSYDAEGRLATSAMGGATEIYLYDGEGRRVMKEPWTAGNQVSLRTTDTAARGSWRGVYGAHGYMMAGSDVKTPVYASVTLSGQTLTSWSPSTTDVRALQNVAGTNRVAAAWTSTSSFTLDVTISDNRTHQLALYMMDWTSSGSQESVTIADGGTNAVLATQSVSQFSGGVYAVWSVSGHVKITVTAQGGTTAMVSGLFWDAAPGNTTYVYGAGGQLAAEYGSGTAGAGLQYLAADHLGSTRLVTAGATPTKRYDYWPFGEEMLAGIGGRTAAEYNAAVPTVAQPDPTTGMKFSGKERDQETGLDYFGARYFSAAQGRFTSPDEFTGGIVDPSTGQQVGQPGPLPYADITNPQSLNKYAYVMNNPLRYTDPDGHCTNGQADDKGPCPPSPPPGTSVDGPNHGSVYCKPDGRNAHRPASW